jgi:hypothetical protein
MPQQQRDTAIKPASDTKAAYAAYDRNISERWRQ